MAENKKDFFISYNGKDKGWAEWIAWQLEATGYTVVIQAWDFRPGDNFGLKMHEATTKADRTLAVLSPNYLAALYTQPEWEAAFVQDPTGAKRSLLPVRVAECKPSGLLAPIIYIDLVGRRSAQWPAGDFGNGDTACRFSAPLFGIAIEPAGKSICGRVSVA